MSSPARRSSTGGCSRADFATALRKCAAPIPPVLSRKLGRVSESPLGKVKVMLRIGENADDVNGILGVDSRRKQVTLTDPGGSVSSGVTPEERRVGVSAPKMFAFDGIFGVEDDQAEICAASAAELVASVVGGEDGCFVSLGSSSTGKKETMFGKPANQKMGVVPMTISWLFKSIQDQKLKTGSRYSVRISALTITGGSGHEVINDLLLPFANDGDQPPGGNAEPSYNGHGSAANGAAKFNSVSLLSSISEVRASSPEQAGLYFDKALESMQVDDPVRHFLFTIHLYQYTQDKNGKGGVGGRSRLHCVNLGNGSPSISVLGGLLLAVLNAQRHLPSRDSKLGAILRECLGSLTCRAVVMIHVSNAHSRYAETLAALQLGSRVHRLRRSRRLKMGSVGSGNGSGGSSGGSGEEMRNCPTTLLTGPTSVGATISEGDNGSSDIDPSSSEQSCDTVIYLGPSIDDCTDGENPPVYLPSLDGQNGIVIPKIQTGKVTISSASSISPPKTKSPKPKTTPKHHNSNCPAPKSEEQWVDGPKLPKFHHPNVATITSTNGHSNGQLKKSETWIDGPAAARIADRNHQANNFPSPKKSNLPPALPPAVPSISSVKAQMIQQWICNQTNSGSPFEDDGLLDTSLYLLQSNHHCHHQCQYMSNHYSDAHQTEFLSNGRRVLDDEPQYRSLTVFKTCDDDDYFDAEDPYACNGFDFEFIEVVEPETPVPTRDASFQVTEEDIALSFLEENPLPESDQNFTMGSDAYYFPSSVATQLSPKTTPGLTGTATNPTVVSVSNGHHVKSLTQVLEHNQPPIQSSSTPLSSSLSSVSGPPERSDDDHPLRALSQESLTLASTFSGSLPRNGNLENYWPRYSYADPVMSPETPRNGTSHFHHHNHGLCKNLASLSQMSLVDDDTTSGTCCIYSNTIEKPVILSPLSTLRNNIKSSEITALRPKVVPVPAPPTLSDESIFKIPMTPVPVKKINGLVAQATGSRDSDAEQEIVPTPMKLLDMTPIASNVEVLGTNMTTQRAPPVPIGCDHNHIQLSHQSSPCHLNGKTNGLNGNMTPPSPPDAIHQTKSPSKSKSRKIAKFFRGRSKSPKKSNALSSSESGKSSGSSTVSAETKSSSSSGASSCSSSNSPSNATNNNHKGFKFHHSNSPSPSKKHIIKGHPLPPSNTEFVFRDSAPNLKETENETAKN